MFSRYFPFVIISLYCILGTVPAYSQTYSVEYCVSYSTGKHKVGGPPWTERKGGVTYSCRCDARQGTVCTPVSSTMPSGKVIGPSPFGKGGSASQQMAAALAGAFLGGLSGMYDDDTSAPSGASHQDALRAQQQQELLKQQEIQKKALKQWLDSQVEAEARRIKEDTERKKRGEAILAKASIGSGELRKEPLEGGKLAPFTWDAPRVLEPAPSGQYDISQFTELERLLCVAYFSKMAEVAAGNGDFERAGFIGSQVNTLMQKNAKTIAIECKPPKDVSSIVEADMKRAGAVNEKYARMVTLYKEITPKIEKLQTLETQLGELRKTKEDAGEKIKELDKQIELIKSRIPAAGTPEQKNQDDDLLRQALALRSEAEQQQQAAMESEEKLLLEIQETENELKAIKDQIQAGSSFRKALARAMVWSGTK